MTGPRKKKLIEVGLPLEKINAESAREKSIRHGHPSTLHLWWARRPLATARAVLFAQLVDDPSSHPELFPTVAEQDDERTRLHELIEALVVWENTAPDAQGIVLQSLGKTVSGRELFAMARDEIRKSNDGKLPPVLDPFAGGGTIPLEAQRLGLEAHASDLNPVAVLINKALIEIPPKFAGRPPVHPGQTSGLDSWQRAEGLAEDVRYYGAWMRDEAYKRIGHLYPTVTDGNGVERTVIAWIWARTVKSPNPANPIEVPLVRSWWLSKKKGKEAWIKAELRDGRVQYEVQHDARGPRDNVDGTVNRANGVSIVDGTPIPMAHIRSEAQAGRMGASLMAVVAEGERGRAYISPSGSQIDAATVDRPVDVVMGTIDTNPRWFSPPAYGLTEFSDLFTNRQLVAMTTFSDLVAEAREQVLADALSSRHSACSEAESQNPQTPPLDPATSRRMTFGSEGERLEAGGQDAAAYADAVATYLGMAVSRLADRSSSICTWDSSRDSIRNVFGRQAIPMSWDFAESNPLSTSTGNFVGQTDWIAEVIERVPSLAVGATQQADAANRSYADVAVSTDPPYYDNIGYSDLSDYFYVWQRRSLLSVYPSLFSTMLVPKAEELVANPYRHEGKDGAEQFFVAGFNQVFAHIRESANPDVPLTVYYAYKQQDAQATGTTSTGWHTLLDGLVKTGWEITATWPVRSELSNRMIASGTNALASSIVLACRPRPEDAPATTRRQLISALKAELPEALRTMMQGAVAPVDLAQAAIGPGISIFSRYSRVRESDGSDMSVRDALTLVNATLDEVMDEQESDFDPETRFAVKWYRTYGWATESSGTADTLARATGTSPSELERGGIFEARGGKAKLLSPTSLQGNWHPEHDERVSIWEATVRLAAVMAKDGTDQVAALLPSVGSKVSLDMVKELGFLLFHEAEKNGHTQDAILFNGLVSAWSDLTTQARTLATQPPKPQQDAFDFGEDS
jgi:putative DNA methylase